MTIDQLTNDGGRSEYVTATIHNEDDLKEMNKRGGLTISRSNGDGEEIQKVIDWVEYYDKSYVIGCKKINYKRGEQDEFVITKLVHVAQTTKADMIDMIDKFGEWCNISIESVDKASNSMRIIMDMG